MPHNITGTNTFTNPVPTYSDGDPVAQASEDPTVQALANRDVNLNTRLSLVEPHVPMVPWAWGIVNMLSGSPALINSRGLSSPTLSIVAQALQIHNSVNFGDGVYSVHTQLDFSWSVNPSVLWSQSLGSSTFIIGGIYLGGSGVYSPAGIDMATVTGYLHFTVMAAIP